MDAAQPATAEMRRGREIQHRPAKRLPQEKLCLAGRATALTRRRNNIQRPERWLERSRQISLPFWLTVRAESQPVQAQCKPWVGQGGDEIQSSTTAPQLGSVQVEPAAVSPTSAPVKSKRVVGPLRYFLEVKLANRFLQRSKFDTAGVSQDPAHAMTRLPDADEAYSCLR